MSIPPSALLRPPVSAPGKPRDLDAAELAAVLDALRAQVALLDTRGTIISVNAAWRRFGVERGADGSSPGIGANYLETCDQAQGPGSDHVHEVAAGIRAVLDGTSKRFSVEYPCLPSARDCWLRTTVTPLAEGSPGGAVVMHLNVTEERQVQDSLRTSEARFRQMAESIGDVFFLQNLDSSRMYYVSPAYERVWGRTCASLYADATTWLEAIHPEDLARVLTQSSAGRPTGSDYEFRIVRPDGETRWIHVRGFPILDAAGVPFRTAGVASDVTLRKLTEQALGESERRFGDLLRNVALAAVMLDRDARITFCNDYLLGLTGWRLEEVVGQSWFDLFVPPEDKDRRDVFAAVLQDRPDVRHREDEILTRSGGRRLLRWSNSVLRSGANDVVGAASIGEDITEHKRSERVAKQSEERRRLIMDSALDAVVVMDAAGLIAEWSTQAEKTFGWSRMQVLGVPLAGIIVPVRYREAHKHGFRRFLDTGKGTLLNKRIEIFALHRDGHEFPVELTISPVRVDETWIFSAYIRDLTEPKRAERALEEMRRQSDMILEAVGEGIHGIDTQGRIIFENPAAEKLLGYGRGDLAGHAAHEATHHSRADGSPYPLASCPVHATLEDGKARKVEDEVFWRKDGTSFPVEYTTAPIRDERGRISGVVVAFRDVTERRDAEKRIRRLSRVHAVLSGINTLIVRVSERDELFRGACRIAVEAGAFRMAWIGLVDTQTQEGKVVAWHGGEQGFVDTVRLTTRAGTADSERPACRAMRESRPVICNDLATDPTLSPSLRESLLKRGHRSFGCFPLKAEDRTEAVLVLLADEPDVFDAEETRLLLELADDISFALDHIEKKERLDYLAYYDVLTGLANRSLFLERLAQRMRNAANEGQKLALYVLDLERFKNINDTLGQAAGDALLVQVTDWLKHNAGDANLVARVGADQFAVLLPQVAREGEVARLLEKAIGDFQDHPFRLKEAIFRVSAKVGAAMFPDDGSSADTLFRNAEAALKAAKARGDRYLFFNPRMTAAIAGRLTLETQLRHALDRDEFVLHYQPKMALADGGIASAEALIRWNDPQTGLVPPGRFIPVLEDTGLIHEVGRWALRKAIEDYLRWRAAGLSAVRVAVNVSPLQLRNAGFIEEVRQALAIDAHAAAGLELEITESLIMADVKHSIESLRAIRAMGVTIAIDDFGTGYSSLSYLARLPVHTLKIDRSFILDMTTGPEGLALVSTIVSLAHSLKLKVVAEGVETEEQRLLLRSLDCDEVQGYLFSQPLPSAAFEAKYLCTAPHRPARAHAP